MASNTPLARNRPAPAALSARCSRCTDSSTEPRLTIVRAPADSSAVQCRFSKESLGVNRRLACHVRAAAIVAASYAPLTGPE